MAHSKNHKLRCPRCNSTNGVRCKGGRVKIFYSRISVEYKLECTICGAKKSRTVFSDYDKRTKIHGLSCPFCGSGRKNHDFSLNYKEVCFA